MKTRVCLSDEMAVNEIRPIKVGELSVLVIRLEEGFYATQARCTHLFRSMAKGQVEDGKIRCPLHRAKFCVRTGEVKKWANFPPGVQLLNSVRKEKALKIYEVEVDDGVVYVTDRNVVA
ncbi:MAG: hypothetical protein CL693_16455 [Cellvibrionaceae bacterium]|nr:hypothetical protein [Cellvibrionaceae bacterium]